MWAQLSSCVFTRLDSEDAIEMSLTSISQSKHAAWVCMTTHGMAGGHLGTILLASCTASWARTVRYDNCLICDLSNSSILYLVQLYT